MNIIFIVDAAVDPPAAVGSSTSAGSPAGTDDRIPCKAGF